MLKFVGPKSPGPSITRANRQNLDTAEITPPPSAGAKDSLTRNEDGAHQRRGKRSAAVEPREPGQTRASEQVAKRPRVGPPAAQSISIEVFERIVALSDDLSTLRSLAGANFAARKMALQTHPDLADGLGLGMLVRRADDLVRGIPRRPFNELEKLVLANMETLSSAELMNDLHAAIKGSPQLGQHTSQQRAETRSEIRSFLNEALEGMVRLKVLNLSGAYLENEINLLKLPRTLKELDLSRQFPMFSSFGFDPQTLRGLDLDSLSLAQNYLGGGGAESINFKGLSINSLDLSQNGIRSATLQNLMLKDASISFLRLDKNLLGDHGLLAMSRQFKENKQQDGAEPRSSLAEALKGLSLLDNTLSSDVLTNIDFSLLALDYLDVSLNDIRGVRPHEMFKDQPLTALMMSACDLEPQDLERLPLAQLKSLTALDLSRNDFAAVRGEKLTFSDSLNIVDLSYSGLNERATDSLDLSRCKLSELYLDGNKLSYDSLRRLKLNFGCLTKLDLSDMDISAEDLSLLLAKAGRLQSLSLVGCTIKDGDFSSLNFPPKQIKDLSLENISITTQDAQVLADKLRHENFDTLNLVGTFSEPSALLPLVFGDIRATNLHLHLRMATQGPDGKPASLDVNPFLRQVYGGLRVKTLFLYDNGQNGELYGAYTSGASIPLPNQQNQFVRGAGTTHHVFWRYAVEQLNSF